MSRIIARRWIYLGVTHRKSTLVQVMAWCCQWLYQAIIWVNVDPAVCRYVAFLGYNEWTDTEITIRLPSVCEATIKNRGKCITRIGRHPWYNREWKPKHKNPCAYFTRLQSMMTSSNGNIFRVTGHLCGEFTGEFPTQRPVMRSFDVFFHLRLNKQLSKQSWGWWFETPIMTSLWCMFLWWRSHKDSLSSPQEPDRLWFIENRAYIFTFCKRAVHYRVFKDRVISRV